MILLHIDRSKQVLKKVINTQPGSNRWLSDLVANYFQVLSHIGESHFQGLFPAPQKHWIMY